MRIAIQCSLRIPVPIPAKKIVYKKTTEDKKPAAKKATDTKKLTFKPKVAVDTLYGNKTLSGEVTIKQDKVTGKVNLIQEVDKEATGEQTPESKESKLKHNEKAKKKSVVSSGAVKGQQSQQGEKVDNADKLTHSKKLNDSTEPSTTGTNKTDNTNDPNPRGQESLKDESTGEDMSDQGKSWNDVPPSTSTQDNPDHQSDKKMTAQEWGS
jgi:hypothetical protein